MQSQLVLLLRKIRTLSTNAGASEHMTALPVCMHQLSSVIPAVLDIREHSEGLPK